MLSNQIRAVFAGRFCLGEGEEEEEEREKSNERRVNRVDTFSRDERFRGRRNSSPNFRDKSFAGRGEVFRRDKGDREISDDFPTEKSLLPRHLGTIPHFAVPPRD